MNPKEFGWEESQQVTVTNPTEKDYRFKVYNKDYEVKAGQTVKMPGFIAWVYVYGLACQMAQENNDFIHWNEEGFRARYYAKVAQSAADTLEVIETEQEADTETFEEEDDAAQASSTEPVKRRRARRPRTEIEK